jgi:hypothetical protein
MRSPSAVYDVIVLDVKRTSCNAHQESRESGYVKSKSVQANKRIAQTEFQNVDKSQKKSHSGTQTTHT